MARKIQQRRRIWQEKSNKEDEYGKKKIATNCLMLRKNPKNFQKKHCRSVFISPVSDLKPLE